MQRLNQQLDIDSQERDARLGGLLANFRVAQQAIMESSTQRIIQQAAQNADAYAAQVKALFIQPKESLLDRAIRIQHDKGKEKASDEAKVSSLGVFSGSTSSSVVANNEDAVTSSCKNANQ